MRQSTSIENAYTGVVQLMVAGLIGNTHPLFQSALSYASSKLGNWASVPMDIHIKKEKPVAEKSNSLQRAILMQLAKEKGYDKQPDAVKAIIITITKGKKQTTQELDMIETGYLIEKMKEGVGLKQEKTLGPENIPF